MYSTFAVSTTLSKMSESVWGIATSTDSEDTHSESIFIKTGPQVYKTKKMHLPNDLTKHRVSIEVREGARAYRSCKVNLPSSHPFYQRAVELVDELAKCYLQDVKVSVVDRTVSRKLFF